jgi:peptide deformylase
MPDDDTTEPRAPHGPLPTGGTPRAITRWGTPVMHRAQQPVTSYDDELATLAADMVATMYAADGVGLAACQVGEDVAMFVFDCPDDEGERTVGVVCNPVLTLPEGKDRQLDSDEEGCLSYPGSFEPCARPDWARIDGFGLDGEPVSRPHPRHRLRRPALGQVAQEARQEARRRGRGLPAHLARLVIQHPTTFSSSPALLLRPTTPRGPRNA